MGLFSKNLVDKEVAEWQFDWFTWLIENFSSGPGLPESELWLPIAEHFEPENHSGKPLQGRTLANHLYARIGIQCGFGSDHNIQLIENESPKTGFLDGGAILNSNRGGVCGQYEIERTEDGIHEAIYYDVSRTENANDLIATFAHEYSHALHQRSRDEIDIEPELEELFTDLTAIYLGYGIFIANTRFELQHDARGWSAQGAGYLPPNDIIFATAIFMQIKDLPMETASNFLKPNLAKLLKKAFKQLENHAPEIYRLRSLGPVEP